MFCYSYPSATADIGWIFGKDGNNIKIIMRRQAALSLFLGVLTSSSCFIFSVAAQVPATSRQSSIDSEAQAASWFKAHYSQPAALRAFVQRMPKGGDIHSHLSGAVYAEHYLEWAATDGYCVNPQAGTLVEPKACSQDSSYFPASELFNRTSVYDSLINRWSTRNLQFAGKSGHDQFFEAFAGFGTISDSATRRDDMVASVANRAASQHITYLELMLTVQGSEVRQLGREVGWNQDLQKMHELLLARGLTKLVTIGSQQIAQLESEVTKTLGCGTPSAQPGCTVTVRYLQQTTRTKSPVEVFAQLAYAFALASSSKQVVGINLVAPEDNPIALRDYTLQMQMLQFLKRQYPNVKVSLHAGELTLGLVPTEHLRFHIRQAVEVAQASRIGHGVDILFEERPFELMKQMQQRGVLVEICLTSNEVILNVKGDNHPFREYWKAGVPMTLASDDEGISRIDLSNEYLLAATRYGLGYQDLKRLARNSLEYSFAPGNSLWKSPEFKTMVGACASDTPGKTSISAECSAFLRQSDRARIQWQLESEFAQFESLQNWL
ncbi:adenosine deaminase [Nostoc sp. FACHB-110]|uniref:adenosine deaminase n=1 Tax=Nostoc sp. FACHB-110 TaxID=2692834 RepID=UPI001F555097|nr:adenosine deaminase [Nostoc sp. FACHB-110]